ncbi:unnamed protein product [Trichobilharzia regenti]|nr:unnamed protein product [Trichobilharzia regenti]
MCATMALNRFRYPHFTRTLTDFALLKYRSKHEGSARCLHACSSPTMSLIPIVLDKTTHGERAFDIYSRLLKDRIICLMGPINDEIAGLVVAQLLYLQSEDKKVPIHIYINSPGQASSMGSLLLAAGAPGLRFALPHSRIMVHQPSGSAHGIDLVYEIVCDTYPNLNHVSLHVIEKWMDRDYFMTADEAVSCGIVDTVLHEAPADQSKELEHSKSLG